MINYCNYISLCVHWTCADVSGRPRRCALNDSIFAEGPQLCPVGYSCRLTSDNKSVCCTVEGADKFIGNNNRPPSTKGPLPPVVNKVVDNSPKSKLKPGGAGRKDKLKPVDPLVAKLAECRPNEILVDGTCV